MKKLLLLYVRIYSGCIASSKIHISNIGHFHGSVFVSIHAKIFLESSSTQNHYFKLCAKSVFQASSKTRHLSTISTISFAVSIRLRSQGSGMPKNPSISSLVRPAITTISTISGLDSWRWPGKPSFSTSDGFRLKLPPHIGRMLLNSLNLLSTALSNPSSTRENRRTVTYR